MKLHLVLILMFSFTLNASPMPGVKSVANQEAIEDILSILYDIQDDIEELRDELEILLFLNILLLEKSDIQNGMKETEDVSLAQACTCL